MDRALREFRIRGVKTNIPFLENVVDAPDVPRGPARRRRFIDTTPELFHFKPRRDRATKLLNYLGDVIVNGNPEVKGYSPPAAAATPRRCRRARSARRRRRRARASSCWSSGPKKFAEWTLAAEAAAAHRHDVPRRAPVAAGHARAHLRHAARSPTPSRTGCRSCSRLEMWGGATFDTSMRFLSEDPWERLRAAARARSRTSCFQMLLRGANAVGYTNYPDNVVPRVRRSTRPRAASTSSASSTRSTDLPNLQRGDGGGAARRTPSARRRSATPATSSTRSATSTRSKYYVQAGQGTGAHGRAHPGHQGHGRAVQARTPPRSWSRRCKEEVGIPIHFHTHDTSGVNAAAILRAAEAGVDVADAALASMSGSTVAAEPELDRGRAAAHAARHRARPRRR